MADVALGSDAANITAINVVDQASDPTAPGSGHILLYVKGGVLYARGNAGSPAAVGSAPTLTENRIGVGDGNDLLSALAQGDEGKILTAHGASVPTWEDPPEGGSGGNAGHIYVPWWAYSAASASTWVATINAQQIGGSYSAQTNRAQNDYLEYAVDMPAGTYTFRFLYVKASTIAIATVSINGTSIGTFDGYAGVATYNGLSDITDVVVASGGIKAVRLTAATRNAQCNDWYICITSISAWRTA